MGPGPELGALVALQGSCISTMTSVDVSSERQVRAVLGIFCLNIAASTNQPP